MNDTTFPPLNITRLTGLLWTGGDLPEPLSDAARAIRAWQELGVRAIVDSRIEWNDEETVAAVAPDMSYLHAGVDDAGQRMPDWWFDAVTHFAIDHINRGAGVLVHCHMGINRGPSAAFAVLLAMGWDPVEAIELIRAARPVASVSYAEDALEWWQRRTAIGDAARADQRRRLTEWRETHPHDTVRIIRAVESGSYPS